MTRNGTSPWIKRLYLLCVAALAVTGLAQMPIFKRYYVADIPGLGWLADFYLTHALHYGFAALFLFLLFYSAAKRVASGRTVSFTVTGKVWVLVLGLIVVTGILRTLKNFPSFSYSPGSTMILDVSHLFLAFALGAVAIAAKVLKRPYIGR